MTRRRVQTLSHGHSISSWARNQRMNYTPRWVKRWSHSRRQSAHRGCVEVSSPVGGALNLPARRLISMALTIPSSASLCSSRRIRLWAMRMNWPWVEESTRDCVERCLYASSWEKEGDFDPARFGIATLLSGRQASHGSAKKWLNFEPQSAWHLEGAGIRSVLVGGAVVAI